MLSPSGSSQQYLGQEDYYGGEQYGHSQAASEPLSQQYYPDGEAHARGRGSPWLLMAPLLLVPTAEPSPAEQPESPMPELLGTGKRVGVAVGTQDSRAAAI